MKARFVVIAAVAIVLAALPVRPDTESPVGLGLAGAACDERSCGVVAKTDCFCPDWQEFNRRPHCVS